MSLVSKILFVVSCVPVLFFSVTFSHTPVFAQGNTNTNTSGGGNTNTNTNGGGNTNTPEVQTVTLQNPLVVNSLEDLIVAILNIFITLMIPIIVFFIILAGFKYVTAQGNSGQIEEATTTFTYAVIGGVLILAAVAIAEIIKNTVDSFSV